MKKKVFFIDPMSYHNLEIYDIGVLSCFKNDEIVFFGNMKFSANVIFNKRLIYNYSSKKGVFKFVSYFLSQFKLMYYILIESPNVIHFQWFKSLWLDYLILSFLKLNKKKYKLIFTAHNILPHDSGDKYFRILYKILNVIDFIIVHDFYTKKKMMNLFNLPEDKVIVIKHGLINIKTNEKDVLNFKKKINFKDKIVFSFLGNISYYKGIDLLVSSWKKNQELNNNNNIQLIIAGKGEFDTSISKFENVLIDNRHLSDSEFLAYIKSSDIVLLPYRNISQSGVLLTVLNEKKLVIVSNRGGLVQPFDIVNVGWVLQDVSEKSLSGTILQSLKEIKKSDNYISDSDFEKLKNYFSWMKISNKHKDIYYE